MPAEATLPAGKPASTAPTVRIRPPRRWEALDLRAVWRFRDLLMAFAVRDVKLRYRQTFLGVVWVVFQPLVGAGIFAFVFGRVAKFDSGGVPYVLFAYTGLLGWNLFSNTVVKTASCLVGNAGLVSKIFFPRLLLPFSAVVSALVDFGIAFVVGIGLLLFYGHPPGLSMLLVPLCLLLLLLLSVGVGMLCAALAVSYRDVLHILPVLLQFLLYGSPVGYTIMVIPQKYHLYYKLNPLAPILEGFRASLLGQGEVGPISATYAVIVSVVIFVAGLLFFRRMERTFADVI